MRVELKILNKEFYRVDKLGGSYYDYPDYQTPGSAAIDLVCTKDITIYPGEVKMIPTGLAIWLGSANRKYLAGGFQHNEPVSYAGLIVPRSGLGIKGLVLSNTVGLIDEDYKNELMVSALNRNSSYTLKDNAIRLKAGDRFAQLLFIPVIKAEFAVVDEFSDPSIVRGGFGSTGV